MGSRDVESGATVSASLLRKIEVGEALKEQIAEAKLEKADARKPAPILANRLDLSEDLVAGRIAGPLTALGGAERLGPFLVN